MEPLQADIFCIRGIVAIIAAAQWIIGVFIAQGFYPSYTITQKDLSDLGATCYNATMPTPGSRDIPALLNNLEHSTISRRDTDHCLRLHDLSRSRQPALLVAGRSLRSRGSDRRRDSREC